MLYGHFSEPDHVFRLCASWPIAVVWQRPPEGWRRREEAAADGVAGAADVGEEANWSVMTKVVFGDEDLMAVKEIIGAKGWPSGAEA